ncbi:MAG: YbjN domain-containing protein [Pseudomonadota bacterium]
MDLSERQIDLNAQNPLELIEMLVSSREWPFERSGENELNINVSGAWCEYSVSLTWHEEIESLHMAAAFDSRVPEEKRQEVQILTALINEQLMLGHFDLWSDDGVILFRHTLMLQGGAHATEDQCDALLQLGIESCERYYPAFQFVVWAGKTAKEAISASMFETAGNA